MEGTLFLWLMWINWVILTFLMRKTPLRFWLSCIVLIMILLSQTYVTISSLHVGATFIVTLILGCILFDVPKRRQILYYVLSTFVISMVYVLIHLYLLYDPAIRLIINPWFMFIGLVALDRLLVKPFKLRVSVLILGMIHGEILRVLLLWSFHYDNTLGDQDFLDHLAVTTSFMVCFTLFEMLTAILQTYVQRQTGRKITK